MRLACDHTPISPSEFNPLYAASHFGFTHAGKEAACFHYTVELPSPPNSSPLSDKRIGENIQLHDSTVQTGDLGVKCNLFFHSS